MKFHKSIAMLLVLLILIFYLPGCGASNTVKGTAIGAAAGGVLGGLIGESEGNTAAGVIIGVAVGGTAGALIGNYMDEQAEEIQNDLENAKVERVGEGIKITFDSGILFAVDSYELNTSAKNDIQELSAILKKYEDTNILVTGHTDSTGPEEYNQELSEDRAMSVMDYMIMQNVSDSRITIVGRGETEPIASNDTETGRLQNRRVEIAIFANEELKEAAKDGDLVAPN